MMGNRLRVWMGAILSLFAVMAFAAPRVIIDSNGEGTEFRRNTGSGAGELVGKISNVPGEPFEFSLGIDIPSGQSLDLTGATVTGAPTWATAQSFPGITLTGNSNFGATTIAGAVTWSGVHNWTTPGTYTFGANSGSTGQALVTASGTGNNYWAIQRGGAGHGEIGVGAANALITGVAENVLSINGTSGFALGVNGTSNISSDGSTITLSKPVTAGADTNTPYSGAYHTTNANIVSKTPTATTAGYGTFLIGANSYLAGYSLPTRRSGLTGGHIVFSTQTIDTDAAILFRVNKATHGATDAATLVASMAENAINLYKPVLLAGHTVYANSSSLPYIGGKTGSVALTTAGGTPSVLTSGAYFDGSFWRHSTANIAGASIKTRGGASASGYVFEALSSQSYSHAADSTYTEVSLMSVNHAGAVTLGPTTFVERQTINGYLFMNSENVSEPIGYSLAMFRSATSPLSGSTNGMSIKTYADISALDISAGFSSGYKHGISLQARNGGDAIRFYSRDAESGNINSVGAWTLGSSSGTTSLEHSVWTGGTTGGAIRVKTSSVLQSGSSNLLEISDGPSSPKATIGVSYQSGVSGSGFFATVSSGSATVYYLWQSGGIWRTSATGTLIGGTGGDVVGGQVSDERLKDNIRPISYGLSTILSLKPIEFDMNGQHKTGFGAQTTQEILPTAVYDTHEALFGEDQPTKLGMDYTQVIAPLVMAVQEQQAMIRCLANADTKEQRLACF